MESPRTIREYTLAKQEVTAAILDANRFLEKQNNGDRVDAAHNLVEKLAEDRFNLAVVGQFKRGKSSLINALIGRNLLPTGILPLTSAITALCYGPQDRVLLKFKGWHFEKEITLPELAEYITERGNPGNQKGLVEAQVELKVPFLRHGLYLVDTPGIGSLRLENTHTTYDYLPDADAIIFVTSAESPLTEAEVQFLSDIRQYVRKLFVVVNKMDLLDNTERNDVLRYIQSGIENILGISNMHLYPLSTKKGLEAKLRSNPDLHKSSGLADFENELTSFLTKEKGEIFLASILDRMLNYMDHSQTRGGKYSTDSDTDHLPGRQEIVARMLELREDLLVDLKLIQASSLASKTDGGKRMLAEVASKSQTRPIFGYAGMLRSKQCPICVAQSKVIFDFFSQWQYRLASQVEAKAVFASVRGFCHFHTWQFEQIANAVGISEGYLALVGSIIEHLNAERDEDSTRQGSFFKEMLPTVQSCPACQLLRSVEEKQVQAFIEQIQQPRGIDAYSTSGGLCLPHLEAVLARVETPNLRRELIQQQVVRLEELTEDMHNFLLKRSAVRRELINDEEAYAWKRTLMYLEGDPTVYYGREC
jgi:GTP-binding protein EngB required for normal cell division